MSAPDMLDLSGVIDFSRIADPHARQAISHMHTMAQHRHLQDDVFKETVLARLEAISRSTAGSYRDIGPPPPSPLFPLMIAAEHDVELCESPHGSSGGSLGQSSAAGSETADGPLECPFCGARHNNEKSHVQHLSRLLRRWDLLRVFVRLHDILLQNGQSLWRPMLCHVGASRYVAPGCAQPNEVTG